MIEQIFLGLLLLLLAPFVGAVLVPQIAEWFGSSLLTHAAGMRRLYPALSRAVDEYRGVQTAQGKLEFTLVMDPDLELLKSEYPGVRLKQDEIDSYRNV